MKKIYFIGINGIGMSGLAKIMKCKGYEVEGSDLSRSYVTDELESMGIVVHNEHSEKNLEGKNFDMIIASSAIKKENPEYIYALENGIKVVKRGELLAMLLNEECGIAVAGTHGKTTTSSMAASVMLPLDPTIVVGGILPEIGSNAKPGKSNYFIAEADEYLVKSKNTNGYEEILDFYYEVRSFVSLSELYSKQYTTILKKEKNEFSIKIFCIDPSKNIGEVINGSYSTVIFSATKRIRLPQQLK